MAIPAGSFHPKALVLVQSLILRVVNKNQGLAELLGIVSGEIGSASVGPEKKFKPAMVRDFSRKNPWGFVSETSVFSYT